MHFFGIFSLKNFVDWRKSTIFALDFGKVIFGAYLKGFRRKRSRMGTKNPQKGAISPQKDHKLLKISYNLAVRLKFAAKIRKNINFTKFLDNKIKYNNKIMAQLLNSQDCERVFNGYRKQVARFNSYLEDVIKQVGSNEVYLDKSSTIISAPASVWPIEEVKPDGPGCELLSNDGAPELVFRQKYVWPEYSTGGIIKKEEYCVIRISLEYDEEADEWYAEYHGDSFDFESDLRYTKKCVMAGLKFWQSEDPDQFLEKDDDEEGGES